MENQLIHGNCFDILPTLPDKSFDAIITDPPYGIGLADWDVKIDIPLFTTEVKRLIGKGFYAFFGQMPTVVEWINEANNCKLKYKEHIVWVKRKEMVVEPRLKRKHESIFIYGDNATFFKKTGKYEDVKIPGILFDVVTIQSIQRTFSDLKSGIITRVSRVNFSGQFGNQERKLCQKYGRHDLDSTDFTNVWSFLPPIFAPGRCSTQSYLHPTEKPLELMKRLVEMLTPENGLVLDPFGGSGTTALACLETGRRYVVIEQNQEYFETAQKRVTQWHNDQLNKTGTHELPEGIERVKTDETGQLSLF